MRFIKGSFTIDKSTAELSVAQQEQAAARLRRSQVATGAVYCLFGVVLIVEHEIQKIPTLAAVLVAIVLVVGLLYATITNIKNYKVANSQPDEYQSEIIKNGKANAFNFVTFALILLAVLFEGASKTSVPGLLFLILGIANIIAVANTQYDPKTLAQ